MAAGYCYSLGIKSNNFFLKDNKKAFILWLNVPKVTAYNHYLIQYRSVATGIPIFMVNTKNKHGRGTADIMDNLKDWKGVALMCDGYSGYDWLKKINGRILCRCVVHARRPMERALKENPNLAKIGIQLYRHPRHAFGQ